MALANDVERAWDSVFGKKTSKRKKRPKKITKAQWKTQVQPVLNKVKKKSFKLGQRKSIRRRIF